MIKCITLSFLALSSLYTVHAQQVYGKNNNNVPELFLSETYLSFDETMGAPRGTNNLRGLQGSSNVCRSTSSMTVALPDMTGLTCDRLPDYACTCTASAETSCNYCTLRTHPQFVQCQVSGSVMTFRDQSGISTTCGCEYVGNGVVEQKCFQQDVLVPAPGATPNTGGETTTTSAPVANPTDAPITPTSAPVDDSTPAPVPAPTDAPIAPTDAPVDATSAPVAPTDAPVAPTSAPVTPTEATVVDPTSAPITPTSAPITSETAPVLSPTRAPITPTAAPVVPGTTPIDALPIVDGQVPGAPKGPGGAPAGKAGGGAGIMGRFGGFW